MPRNHQRRNMLLYWIDRMLRSPQSQFIALCLLIAALVGLGGVFLVLAGAPGSLSNSLWNAWAAVTGLGKLADGTKPAVLAVETALTLTRWFIFGFLISMIGTAVRQRLTTIRSGATHVLDRGHTVVLGWNETVYSILDLLHSEDEGPMRGAVVVLSSREKDEMEQLIGKHCRSRRARRTICRTGLVDAVPDLQRINLALARDVIILGEDHGGRDSIDGHVLRSVLACNQVLAGDATASRRRVNVIASHQMPHTGRLIARLAGGWGTMELSTVHSLSVFAKIVAQCAWQPGLAAVYRELLTYSERGTDGPAAHSEGGAEIYCVAAAAAGIPAEIPYRLAAWGVDRAVVIGYVSGGQLVLNPTGPEAEHAVQPTDSIVAMADSRAGIRYRQPSNPPLVERAVAGVPPAEARAVWLIGRGSKAQAILADLGQYLPPGSTIDSGEPPGSSAAQQVTVRPLEAANLTVMPEEQLLELALSHDTIVIASDERDREEHDTAILAQISAIRAACNGSVRQPVVVAELLDPRNRALAGNMDVRDILITSELASNYMVQLVKDPLRAHVYQELLGPSGCEILIRPVAPYLPSGRDEVSFVDLAGAAKAHGETLIGYYLAASDPKNGPMPVLNPTHRQELRPVRDYARLVVIAPE